MNGGYVIFVKVTFLCASGNTSGCTHSLCVGFLQECRSRGHDAELIDLSALDIEDCNGCGVCRKKGRCILKDGSGELFGKVETSDLVVLASPIRFNGPSSIMKRFIDRLNPYWLSDKPHPSRACGILCGGSPEPVFSHALSELRSAAVTLKAEWAGELLVPDTDNGGCGKADVKAFAEKVLS